MSEKEAITVIPSKVLLKNALRAIVSPHKAFKQIPLNQKIDYRIIIPLMYVLGIAKDTWHDAAVHGMGHLYYIRDGVLHLGGIKYGAILTLSMGVAVITIWLLGSILIYVIGVIAKRRIPYYAAEIACFYILIAWTVLPIVDVVHLFGLPFSRYTLLPRPPFLNTCIHFSLLFIVPVIAAELFFLFRDLLKLQPVYAVLLPISMILFVKFGLGQVHLMERPVLSMYSGYFGPRLISRGVTASAKLAALPPMMSIRFYITQWLSPRKCILFFVISNAIMFITSILLIMYPMPW